MEPSNLPVSGRVDPAAGRGGIEHFVCHGWPMEHAESGGWSYWFCRSCRRVIDVNPVPIEGAER